MLYSCVELKNELEKLEIQKAIFLAQENEGSLFQVKEAESIEDKRPNFDFKANYHAIEQVNYKIMNLRNQINIFNVNKKLPCELTIDQAYKLISVLGERKDELLYYAKKLSRIQFPDGREYIINYDPAYVRKELEDIIDTINQLNLEIKEAELEKEIEIEQEEEE